MALEQQQKEKAIMGASTYEIEEKKAAEAPKAPAAPEAPSTEPAAAPAEAPKEEK